VLATTAASAVTAAQSTVTTAVVPRGRLPRRRRRGVLATGRRRRHMVPTKASLLHRLRGPVPGSGCRGACGRSGFGSMYHGVQACAVGSRAECRCVRAAHWWLARLARPNAAEYSRLSPSSAPRSPHRTRSIPALPRGHSCSQHSRL